MVTAICPSTARIDIYLSILCFGKFLIDVKPILGLPRPAQSAIVRWGVVYVHHRSNEKHAVCTQAAAAWGWTWHARSMQKHQRARRMRKARTKGFACPSIKSPPKLNLYHSLVRA